MFAAFMNTNNNSRPRNMSKQDFLLDRAKERIELRKRQDGNKTWRDLDGTNSVRNGEIVIWGSPSQPAAKKKNDRSRSRSESVESHSSSANSSSSGSYSSSSVASSSSSESEYSRRKRRRSDKNRGRTQGRRKKRSSRRKRSVSSSSSSSRSNDSDSDSSASSASKSVDSAKAKPASTTVSKPPVQDILDEDDLREAKEFKKAIQGKAATDSDSDDDDMGPMPLVNADASANGTGGGQTEKAYGSALLPGEGEALAAYVQQNLRIPRRGEIGYDAEDIDKYEVSGYVMSGSRHAKMNAVRIRKENQVYSAEEQRALALITLEENQQKEAALLNDFRTMLKEKQSKLAEKDS